jgi:hypothetical protein
MFILFLVLGIIFYFTNYLEKFNCIIAFSLSFLGIAIFSFLLWYQYDSSTKADDYLQRIQTYRIKILELHMYEYSDEYLHNTREKILKKKLDTTINNYNTFIVKRKKSYEMRFFTANFWDHADYSLIVGD